MKRRTDRVALLLLIAPLWLMMTIVLVLVLTRT